MLRPLAYILVFVICVVVLARVRSRPARQTVLLVASLGLYLLWSPWFAAVLLGSSVINFLLGLWIRRKPFALPLSAGIIFNLGVLAAFKYLPDFAASHQASTLHPFATLALPLGISFWTFQALSYLLDLYREEEIDPSFFEFLLYMSFFPVTISGPVCRVPEMLPQFRSEEPTGWPEIIEGLRRIAIGALMMEFAKLLGHGILGGDGIVSGFDHLTTWSGPDVWCLAFGYGLQLFFDFAGYSHIAIGAAKALGISVPENFNLPFASTSPSVFWTRWHMSLSFWIRDYVFLPLATMRREIWWRNAALVLSMILFGLWHRGTILFLVWGAYHGVLLVAHRQLQKLSRTLPVEPAGPLWSLFCWLVTISLISVGWILFRANSWNQAQTMLRSLASPGTYGSHSVSLSLYALVSILAAAYAVVAAVSQFLKTAPDAPPIAASTRWSRLAHYRWYWLLPLYVATLLLVLLINLTQQGGTAQFIYRQF